MIDNYDDAADKLLAHIARRSRQTTKTVRSSAQSLSSQRATVHVVINRPRECTFVLGPASSEAPTPPTDET